MIYNYTKCESVIAKIMADSDMPDKNIRLSDIREWIFEAIEKIGAPILYVDKETGEDHCPPSKLEDYQIAIPDDLHNLISLAYSETEHGPWTIARKTNELFPSFSKQRINKLVNVDEEDEEDNDSEDTTTSEPLVKKINDFVRKNGINPAYLYNTVKFTVKPGWFVLNKKTGYVKLHYKAIPTDERGYPLIPSTASYLEAVYWYVMMKLTFPKWLKGNFETKRAATGAQYAYTYIQLQWNFYRNQAYAEAMMPTESDMISIKNEWNRLVPEYDSDETFFHTSGEKQLNYTDYYYGY